MSRLRADRVWLPMRESSFWIVRAFAKWRFQQGQAVYDRPQMENETLWEQLRANSD
jgi:hypothetical protein